jgi:hypothetical protein
MQTAEPIGSIVTLAVVAYLLIRIETRRGTIEELDATFARLKSIAARLGLVRYPRQALGDVSVEGHAILHLSGSVSCSPTTRRPAGSLNRPLGAIALNRYAIVG